MNKKIWFRSLILALAVVFFAFDCAAADTIEAATVTVLDYSQLENVVDLETQDKTDITGFPKEMRDMQEKR